MKTIKRLETESKTEMISNIVPRKHKEKARKISKSFT